MKLKLLLALLPLAVAYGCNDKGKMPDIPETDIESSADVIVVPSDGGKQYIVITANSGWSVKSLAGWIIPSPAQGSIGATNVVVTVDPSQDGKSRGSALQFTSNNSMKELFLPVFQVAAGDALVVFPAYEQIFDPVEHTLVITVMCNEAYNVDIEADGGWISQTSVEKIADNVQRYTFTIPSNDGRIRNGSIIFTSGSQSDPVSVSVTQSGTAAIPDKDGATIKGEITCEGKPMKGIVVSDGIEITTTDDQGLYWLNSAKKNGYVFITLPGGYMVDCRDAIPEFWHPLSGAAAAVEEHSFQLKREPNDNHILLATTDAHMANRQNYNKRYTDTKQYREDFRSSIDAYVRANSDKNIYAICLGDLTWDNYWYDSGTLYTLADYRKEISTFPIPYFQVIGNHDYDVMYSDDFKASEQFRIIIGPTYYSFNLGQVHYVVLDNMVYINNNKDRSFDIYIDADQMAWLKQDLTYADKSKPLFVCMHCPAYTVWSVSNDGISVWPNFSASQYTAELGDCFAGFSEVHYLSGHTHISRPVAPEDMPAGYQNIFEHNMGAICATWWWTGYLSFNSICKDGTEGGYMVFELRGSDVGWRWKGMKVAEDKQFRTYDMNVVKDYYANSSNAKAFRNKYTSRTNYSKYPANTVFINVWNWDSGWKVVVKENGQELPVNHIMEEDPLHTLSYDIPRTVENGSLTSSFKTNTAMHIFTVVASSATSALDIEVTDRFGTKYTEKMVRPKEFTIDMP